MTVERLKMATIPYDRTNALLTGEVIPEGIELDYITTMPGHDIFLRMVEEEEFDVSEMSLGLYCVQKARDQFPFIALPVFLSNMFRHRNIYVNRAANIESPRHLEGRRVGIQEYRQSTLIWVRGILRDEYGVDTKTCHWVEGGVNKPRKPRETDVRPPPESSVSIDSLDAGDTLSAALAEGRLDAAICARRPSSFDSSDSIVRLLPDYKAAEREYFKSTGIFPIMHLAVMREDLFLNKPWIAQNLFNAFAQAKAIAWRRLHYGALAVMLPWLHDQVDELDEVFAGNPFRYGLEPNRAALEAFLRYLVEDELLDHAPPVESLFVNVDTSEEERANNTFYW